VRVLVVEDELRMAGLIRRGPVQEGLAADVAEKGEDALWMSGAHEYDVIVLDVMLPGIDGLETCSRLRKNGIWAPVLMLTARDSVEDRVAGLDTGADDNLAKPFAFAELLARLRALAPAATRSGRTCSRSATFGSIRRPARCGGETRRSVCRRRSSRCSRRSCGGPARSSPLDRELQTRTWNATLSHARRASASLSKCTTRQSEPSPMAELLCASVHRPVIKASHPSCGSERKGDRR
jgi:CheY-like chemotaxis protein